MERTRETDILVDGTFYLVSENGKLKKFNVLFLFLSKIFRSVKLLVIVVLSSRGPKVAISSSCSFLKSGNFLRLLLAVPTFNIFFKRL